MIELVTTFVGVLLVLAGTPLAQRLLAGHCIVTITVIDRAFAHPITGAFVEILGEDCHVRRIGRGRFRVRVPRQQHVTLRITAIAMKPELVSRRFRAGEAAIEVSLSQCEIDSTGC